MLSLNSPYSVCLTGMQMVLKQALATGYTASASFRDNSTDKASLLGGNYVMLSKNLQGPSIVELNYETKLITINKLYVYHDRRGTLEVKSPQRSSEDL